MQTDAFGITQGIAEPEAGEEDPWEAEQLDSFGRAPAKSGAELKRMREQRKGDAKGGGKGKPKGAQPVDECNVCGKPGHWARECLYKDCKRDSNGKAIITPADKERVKKLMQARKGQRAKPVHDVEIENEEGHGDYRNTDALGVEMGGLGAYLSFDAPRGRYDLGARGRKGGRATWAARRS